MDLTRTFTDMFTVVKFEMELDCTAALQHAAAVMKFPLITVINLNLQIWWNIIFDLDDKVTFNKQLLNSFTVSFFFFTTMLHACCNELWLIMWGGQ